MNSKQIRGWLPVVAATIALAAGLAIAAAALLGGPAPDRAEAAATRPALKSMGSCDRLRSYLRRHRGDVTAPYMVAGMGVAAPAAEDAAGAAPAEQPTNVQEAGVDEADIVKTDGSTILTVDGHVLRAVDTSSGSPELAGTLRLPRGPGGSIGEYQLLVAGDRLLAIGTGYGAMGVGAEAVATDVVVAAPPKTVLAEVDIADPAAMRVLRTEVIDGSYVSARLSGATARVVSASYPPATIAGGGNGGALVPRARVHDRVTGATKRGPLVGCDAIARPARFSGTDLVSVLTIDLERGLPAADVDSVLSGGDTVYASPTSLYVATERWAGGAGGASAVSTEIHRFDTTAPDATEYVASGKVRGYMLSQWSMSEQDGLLRVASTTSPPWDPDGSQQGESQSFVTVLGADGERLREVGAVGGLGDGEDIYAVRFIGDQGYVVTFRQVDPLYVIDLADPTAPRVAGELKIPGYSAYLHPVGPGLLLGVGQDVGPGGTLRGVQASLFDVSDASAPVRVDHEAFGAASSTEVEYDHHAFSWFADSALAMIPLESYAPGAPMHSAAGLRVTPGVADPLGRVARVSRGGGYRAQIRRTLELDGRVYAIAANGVSAYEPATLAPVGSLDY